MRKVLLIFSIVITLLNYICLYNHDKKKNNDSVTNTTERAVHRALIILDDWNMVETHSMFWDQLKNASYVLEFKMVDEVNIKLDYYREKLYESIILCVPSLTDDQARNTELSIKKILQHFDDGHNIMIIGDKNVNSYMRNLVTEFGVDFDDYDSQVKDSFHLHSLKNNLNQDLIDRRDNEIIVTKNVIPIKNVFTANNYILYEGIGMETDPHNNYVFSALRADDNSYSVNSKTGLYYSFGDKIKLVAAYQGRNNKRVTITGSSKLCSNEFYFLSSVNEEGPLNSANAVFCNELIMWNFERSGLLKYKNERHQRKEDGKTLEIYKIKDELEYLVDIFEYEFKTDSWKPYMTDDLQIEYTMMDPYYRLQLKMLAMGKPTYITSFKVIIIKIFYFIFHYN